MFINICRHFKNKVDTVVEIEKLEIYNGVFWYSLVIHPSFYAVQAQSVISIFFT